MTVRRLTFSIPSELDGAHVDTALRKHMGVSSTWIRRIKWLEDGILLNGVRATPRWMVYAGDSLSIRLSDPWRRSDILPAPGALAIVYEDEDVLVLNKEPGVSVHPGPGHYSDTIGNFLLYYYDFQGVEGDYHPVHRLDRGTSGLLLVAKHPYAQERLNHQLHTSAFSRAYLAICHGVPFPELGTIDLPIGRMEHALTLRQVRPDGRRAVTQYEVIRSRNGLSLLRLNLDTGRTHQIRVHMAHLGHPLAGDPFYGREEPNLIARTALHSHQIEFLHPVSGTHMTFALPMPDDMERLI